MDYEVTYPKARELPEWLVDKTGDTTLAKLFYRRGITTPAAWQQFLHPEKYQPTKPTEFKDIESTRDFIQNRINSGAHICVYGDYDADGITSTAILVHSLRQLGGEVSYHIPDRFTEGYGMEKTVIADLAEQGVDLIITCDCGISNRAEIAQAKELGLEVVITDHHELPEELPAADHILSPKLLAKKHRAYELPGAGIAYMLARALLEQTGYQAEVEKYLELLALAIVADVVPLQEENRYLLQRGLDLLATPSWPGIEALCTVCSLEPFNLGAEEIGFQLGPRLNAAGRISTARKGVELLLAETDQEAKKLAEELDEINSQRKEISDQLEKEALTQLEDINLVEPIVLYNQQWHEGVIGIVAGRLTDRFQVPALLLGGTEERGILRGSARSIAGVSIYQALCECSDLLLTFGGHAGAAGFSLRKEDVDQFVTQITEVLKQKLTTVGPHREVAVDDRIGFDKLSLDFYQQMRQLAPFGEANPAPLFYSSGVEVVSYRQFSQGKHLNLVLRSDGQDYNAVWWRGKPEKLGAEVDIIYSLEVNVWRGQRELQLVIERVLAREGKPEAKEVEFTVKDRRNWRQRGEEMPEFSPAIYYYEGLEDKPAKEVINRYQGKQAQTLVFLTCPPEVEIVRQLIEQVRPEQVVLAYSRAELESSAQFTKKLAGLVKNAVNNQSEPVDIYQLATLTAQRETTITVGLKYLQAQGLVELQFITPGKVLVSRGKKESKLSGEQLKQLKQKLKKLLQESRAFRQYMLQRSLEEVNDLL